MQLNISCKSTCCVNFTVVSCEKTEWKQSLCNADIFFFDCSPCLYDGKAVHFLLLYFCAVHETTISKWALCAETNTNDKLPGLMCGGEENEKKKSKENTSRQTLNI